MQNDFSVMDGPSFMPYESRGPPQQMHRPMPPQYVVEPAYTSAPMSSIPAPQFAPPPAFSYVQYHSPPAIHSSFKQEYHEEHNHSPMDTDCQRNIGFPRDIHLRPSTVRSASIASTDTSNPNAASKTITYNETINPEHRVDFDTEVDQLMKAVQQKADRALSISSNQTCHDGSPASISGASSVMPEAESKNKKKWVCDGPSCNKRFIQKTHLDIHRRTHTGLRPFMCPREGCGLTFSQRGNLKTHIRRHTGEKPYSCGLCGKTFAQRGNVRSHEETHKGLKPYVCKLENCSKRFSQLGNMKTHQNQFHKEALKDLTSTFIRLLAEGEVPESHREMFDYFKEHYKNSNKGIKGRGKARIVAERKPKSAVPRAPRAPRAPPARMVPQYVQPILHHSDVSHQSRMAYTMSHSPVENMDRIPRSHHDDGYAVFEQQSHLGPGEIMYEDGRQMVFVDRVY